MVHTDIIEHSGSCEPFCARVGSEISFNISSHPPRKSGVGGIPKNQITRSEIFPVWTRKAFEIRVLGKARGQKRRVHLSCSPRTWDGFFRRACKTFKYISCAGVCRRIPRSSTARNRAFAAQTRTPLPGVLSYHPLHYGSADAQGPADLEDAVPFGA